MMEYDDIGMGFGLGEMTSVAIRHLETAIKALGEGNRKLALYDLFQAVHLLAMEEGDEVARYALETASDLIRDAMARTR